ncbi:hypothetical protein H2200_012019 [Cladophialophora chaetospira]|uniref:Aspartokinase n=1 Tax=Cladophialophora chaetospira TaxID=386627 RepID=A0AA38WY38_9EURO|nr:hypothetical protein H2200_012019 [Cladophialophora chaetospira]
MTPSNLPNGVHPQLPILNRVNGTSTPRIRAIHILKFGGTSVGKFPKDVVNVVKSRLLENNVAIVCSARSSSSKAAGTTNRLLRAATEAEHHRSFKQIIDDVRQDHLGAADAHVQSDKIRSRLKHETEEECSLVVRILEAAQTIRETSPKVRDMVMSTGEKLSCRFMTAMLQDRGIDAEYVDLADVIDFNPSHGLDQQFYDNVASILARRLREIPTGTVPVITGYFGAIPGGLLTTVGRGYTDLCAALVAVGIKAAELQIWKEVDGIFTADPRKVPTAQLIPQITPAEAAELTFYGSEVIHPSTMDLVIRARIPIRIKNVMNPRGGGTVIYPDSISELDSKGSRLDPKLFRRSRSSSVITDREKPKRPTAVTMKHKILVMNIHSNKRALSHGFFAGIFSTLDKWRLSVDVISTSEVNMSMALHSEAPLYTGGGDDEYQIVDQDLRGAIEELKTYGTVDIIPEMAIVSLVGKQMKNMVGIAGRMFSTLGANHVNIEMISQGKFPCC